MSDTVIQVENISKYYRLGVIGTSTLTDDLNRWWANLRGRPDPTLRVDQVRKIAQGTSEGKGKSGYIWALKDVSFEVKKGEILGIIGRNGAGKSTLLKILSRVTAPTTGECRVKGRIASLLEVGTGFHPELTGRENIYLNGAILGMTKDEIRKKFDEIVAFSEVEKYIDTPVKRYSSGMYVRLAFAVAAHLEPEILIVDEVLAVGDAGFQKKCLGKMDDVSRGGRTILFVSHNMAAVMALCKRGILLENGMLAIDQDIPVVVDQYLKGRDDNKAQQSWDSFNHMPGNDDIKLKYIRVTSGNEDQPITIDTGARIELAFYNFKNNITLDCTICVLNDEGVILFETGYIVAKNADSRIGLYIARCLIPPHLLNAGNYKINILFGRDQRYIIFKMDDVVSFEIENTATGRGSNLSRSPGVIRPLLKWESTFQELDNEGSKSP